MIRFVNNVYSLYKPTQSSLEIPLVLDSPHSGTVYPTNNGIIASANALRSASDMYVNELWISGPDVGASLLSARFPCSYIDLNRDASDIDEGMLQGSWDKDLSPSAACQRGMGLIHKYALPKFPLYRSALSNSEVEHRIQQYYRPYHSALTNLLDGMHERFGRVWHINCYSMKSVGNLNDSDSGKESSDIIVSDCDGLSARHCFAEWIAMQFDDMGYRVRIKDPSDGGYIVRRYGQPFHGRESLQVEIRRSLYMNESTFERTDGFEVLQENLRKLMFRLKQYVEEQIKGTAIAA